MLFSFDEFSQLVHHLVEHNVLEWLPRENVLRELFVSNAQIFDWHSQDPNLDPASLKKVLVIIELGVNIDYFLIWKVLDIIELGAEGEDDERDLTEHNLLLPWTHRECVLKDLSIDNEQSISDLLLHTELACCGKLGTYVVASHHLFLLWEQGEGRV